MIDNLGEYLAVEHEPEGSLDIGLLRVRASSQGFSGSSSAYFNDSRVLAFAGELDGYPLDSPVSIGSGLGDTDAGTYEEHVGIVVRQVSVLGQLSIVVHLAEPWPARADAHCDVRLELLTSYEQIRAFGRDLTRVVKGELDRAHLAGERLG